VGEFLATKHNCAATPSLFTGSSPQYLFLFPKMKVILKGRHFDDIADIRSNKTATVKVIPQNQFQNCFGILDQVLAAVYSF
jgi:hypothetical protein